MLVAALHESDPALRQRGLKRWVLFALVLQSLVIVGVVLYAFAVTRAHHSGFVWIAPPLGALLGTALPYQLAVMRLARAGRE